MIASDSRSKETSNLNRDSTDATGPNDDRNPPVRDVSPQMKEWNPLAFIPSQGNDLLIGRQNTNNEAVTISRPTSTRGFLRPPSKNWNRMEDASLSRTQSRPGTTTISLPFYTTRSSRVDTGGVQKILSQQKVDVIVPDERRHVPVEPIVVLPPEQRLVRPESPIQSRSVETGKLEESTGQQRQTLSTRKEEQEVQHVEALKKKLAPQKRTSFTSSLVSSIRIGVVCTITILCLFGLMMHIVLYFNSKALATDATPIVAGMIKYNFVLLLGIILVVVAGAVIAVLAFVLFWRMDAQHYLTAIHLSKAAAEELQFCRGMKDVHLYTQLRALSLCGCHWRSTFEGLVISIVLASRKVDSLLELIEMAEAEERQLVQQELNPLTVFPRPRLSPRKLNERPVSEESERKVDKKASFRETASSYRRAVGMSDVPSLPTNSRVHSINTALENFDVRMSAAAAVENGQNDAVVMGEIGPMVVYIICRLFIYDAVEKLSGSDDETVSTTVRQMSNTFTDAVNRVAAASGGVVVGVEIDMAIITYNAFSPVPVVSAMGNAYKAAIALEKELNSKKQQLTCEGKLDLSWGMVLQHCRLLVDPGGTPYVKQPYVFSPELEFAVQVVELCKILQCPILSLASNTQSDDTLQIIPVDVIGLDPEHTMFLYELKSRAAADTRAFEDKMIDGLLHVHTHKFDEAKDSLVSLKSMNHSARRLYYLASHLKKVVDCGGEVPNPYYRSGPCWEFLEMFVMKQEYSKAIDKLSNTAFDAQKSSSDEIEKQMSLTALDLPDQPLNLQPRTIESIDSATFFSKMGAKDIAVSSVERTPLALQSSGFPLPDRDDVFADMEKLESTRIEDEMLSIRDLPPSSYSRRGSVNPSLNMSFKIPSLQSSIVVGSSARSQMVSARKAQRAVVITGNESPSAQQDASLIKFILGDLIAEGTEGRKVYRGLHPNGRIVAIKRVPIAEHAIDLRGAERELETLAKLKHPNILRYVASCYTEEYFYIIMELMTGGSLTDLIRNFGALPQEAIRRYAMESLSGLDYLHRRGIVHRDISTNNIMVTIDGECKIADFGGAVLSCDNDSRDLSADTSFGFQWSSNMLDMSCASADSSMNMSQVGHPGGHTVNARPAAGNVFGTPIYMSPQAAQGIVDAKNDIWSFGIVLCYCSTGCIPFRDEDLTEPSKTFLDNLCNGSVRPVIPRGKIEKGLENLIAMCLREELDDRPTAAQLLKNPYILQGNARVPAQQKEP